MKQKIKILGAGNTALLAAIALKKEGFENVIIYHDRPIKRNHFALLRFKTDAISKLTGIEMKKIKVQKAIGYKGELYDKSNIKFDNLYSQRVTGGIYQRSISSMMSECERYIAPEDLYDQLYSICLGMGINFINEILYFNCERHNIINTIPLYELDGFYKDDINFKYKKITILTTRIDSDVEQTIYFPIKIGDKDPSYRITLSNEYIKAEISDKYLDDKLLDQINTYFGVYKENITTFNTISQEYGKLIPIDESIRKNLIMELTAKHNIYSLGRYATWRNIGLDDVVKDINTIINKIKTKSN